VGEINGSKVRVSREQTLCANVCVRMYKRVRMTDVRRTQVYPTVSGRAGTRTCILCDAEA
jgi:hypothetical protein